MKITALVAAGAAVLVLGAAGLTVSQTISARAETDRMASIAGSFPADPAWELTGEAIRGEAVFVCIDTNPCASLHRNWDTGGQLTPEQLRQLGENAGWDLEVEGDCQPDPLRTGGATVCEGSAQVQGYDVRVLVTDDGSGGPQTVSLHLEKIR